MLNDITILYVEDEFDIQEEVESFLLLRCKAVYIADNGKDGLALFKENKPDLVLTDITMPVMGGLEMAVEIRKLNEKTPIILMTALTDTKTLTRAINIGIDGYIGKPISIDMMEKELEKASNSISLKNMLISEQKLLAEYKSAVDEAALVSKTDSHGIITYANPAFVKISGYTLEELIGQPHNIVRHPDTPSSVFKICGRHFILKRHGVVLIKIEQKMVVLIM